MMFTQELINTYLEGTEKDYGTIEDYFVAENLYGEEGLFIIFESGECSFFANCIDKHFSNYDRAYGYMEKRGFRE